MIKNKFLLLPFLIFFLAWCIDKILLTEKIQTYYTKSVSEMNYEHKVALLLEMKEYLKTPGRKKVLAYFGSSRGLLFNNAYIEKNHPDWILFNFSVPGGTPDYFKYLLEILQKEDIHPDFVLLDNSIEAYNLNAIIKIDESLSNGIDFYFLAKHSGRYTSKEVSSFIAKRLFGTYKYKPKFSTIVERYLNDGMIVNHYRQWRNKIREKLKNERGSASTDITGNRTSSPEFIRKFSSGDYNSYLMNFKFNRNMLKFQEENFRILKQMNISHAGIWVRLAPDYFDLIKNKKQKDPKSEKEFTVYEIVVPDLIKIHEENDSGFWNMNEDPTYSCNAFTDASHMASECFPDYTDYIFKNIK